MGVAVDQNRIVSTTWLSIDRCLTETCILPYTECVDLDSQCATWASQGNCKSNDVWMEENCKASCNVCKRSQEELQGMCGAARSKGNPSSGSLLERHKRSVFRMHEPRFGLCHLGETVGMREEPVVDERKLSRVLQLLQEELNDSDYCALLSIH